MRKRIVAGNWKMNKTLEQGVQLSTSIVEAEHQYPFPCDVILCVPFTHLYSIARNLKFSKIKLSAQNISEHKSGAYTGEISAEMLLSCGVTHTLIGHSERRQYHFENDEVLIQKVIQALQHDITPIFCFGEPLQHRERNAHFEYVLHQLQQSIFKLSESDFSKLILAYEPIWAIGTGLNASAEQAQEMHHFIRKNIEKVYNTSVAENCTILYGGSCKSSNAGELFACADVDGGLIGGASLDAEEFVKIILSNKP